MPSPDERYLKQNSEFLDMPSQIRSWIQASPNATRDFTEFFRRDGFIDEGEQVDSIQVHPIKKSRTMSDAQRTIDFLKQDQGFLRRFRSIATQGEGE